MSKWRIYREVDLAEESLGVERLHVLSTVSSRAAHEVSVLVKCGKQYLPLDDAKAFLSVILPDNSSFSEDGEINGSQVSIMLPDICYSQDGEVRGVLHLTMSDASTVPIYGFILLNNADMTEVLADKYNVVPSVSQLLAEIQTLREVTREAKEATTAAETATTACQTATNRTHEWVNATASAERLAEGSEPTVTVNQGAGKKVLHFGIPEGASFKYEDFTPEQLAALSPKRGTDYWTEEDIAAIKSYVDDSVVNGSW